MFFVKKKYDHSLGLSACFRQWRAESHCRFLHGYPLAFEFTFGAAILDKNNWVMDFGGLKEVKAHLCDTYDHKLLVASDDPELDYLTSLGGMGLADPIVVPFVGCEGFAQSEWDWVNDWLIQRHFADVTERGLHLWSVEVREHTGNAAIITGKQYHA